MKCLCKYDIQRITELFDMQYRDQKTWLILKKEFRLNTSDRMILESVKSLVLNYLLIKKRFQILLFDGETSIGTILKPYKRYKLTDSYRWLCPNPLFDVWLNKLWRPKAKQKKFLFQLGAFGSLSLKPKKAISTWSLTLGALTLGHRL